MSGKSFQVPPKTFRLDGRITQCISHWALYRRAGDRESQGVKCAAEYSVYGGWPNGDVGGQKLQRLARSSRQVPRYWRHRWTVTQDCNAPARCGIVSQCRSRNSHERTRSWFLGSCDKTRCSVLNRLQHCLWPSLVQPPAAPGPSCSNRLVM